MYYRTLGSSSSTNRFNAYQLKKPTHNEPSCSDLNNMSTDSHRTIKRLTKPKTILELIKSYKN